MRPTLLTLTALAALACATAALADSTLVQIDHSARLTLKGSAASVFVGNSSIADVAIVNRNTLMIVGKGYGVTSLQVLDAGGRVIMNREIQVGTGGEGRMTLYRATVANNYACAPLCERTPMPGEPNAGVFGPFNETYETYQKRQSSSTAAPAKP